MKAQVKILASLLVGLVLFQSANLTMVRLNFDLNRDFIAKNLCVNRFNPDSNCNGSCILMKKLHAETEKEANQKAVMNPLLTFVFFFQSDQQFIFEELKIDAHKFSNFDQKNFWKEPFIDVPSRPPIMIV